MSIVTYPPFLNQKPILLDVLLQVYRYYFLITAWKVAIYCYIVLVVGLRSWGMGSKTFSGSLKLYGTYLWWLINWIQ